MRLFLRMVLSQTSRYNTNIKNKSHFLLTLYLLFDLCGLYSGMILMRKFHT
jgi:hypothetical protein